MKNVISQIVLHKSTHDIFKYVLNNLYTKGPISVTDMEILSYLNLYEPVEFLKFSNDILKYMAVYYKDIPTSDLKSVVFGMHRKYILNTYKYQYTPVQASIIKGIEKNQCFSFSAPTSTGKSFVFRNIINDCDKDIVIVVPSRALINEYYYNILELIPENSINVLTFIDKINTKKAKRSVFIVTPERCKELFKFKDDFDVEYFLFDEAQLGDEDSIRGMFFDSIIRRIQSAYPKAKYVFAHPFIANPQAQIIKNKFSDSISSSYQYIQKNIGQLFYVYSNEKYYHFGIDKEIMGNRKIECKRDPLMEALNSNGSILVYTTKASIYKKTVFEDFKKYIKQCDVIRDANARNYINQIKEFLGAVDDKNKDKYSNMVHLLRQGIVVHHGSMPLQARLILERFTQEGHCRICFATSTLEQGINMPFDVVFLNSFKASRPLSIKNLIGRAGRSSIEPKFDYGSVIIKNADMSKFRKILLKGDILKDVSLLDSDTIDDDYKDFKEAVNNGTLSDEFNLTETQLAKLSTENTNAIITSLLNSMFDNKKLISLKEINSDNNNKLELYSQFERLYSAFLQRPLVDGERSVFNTAIKIMLWKVHCKTFKDICFYRYSYASKLEERTDLIKKIEKANDFMKGVYRNKLDGLYASFMAGCNSIPNKELKNYSIFGNKEVKATDVDYDRIVFDTYDYLDKIIGFKLSDIFYAAFRKYYDDSLDIRADKLSKLVKYGTDNEREIWLLRYGISFEDIEWVNNYVIEINQEGIAFSEDVYSLDDEKFRVIKRYVD